eukprot:TRINITY_DN14315_c0_g1_i3.p1 TRINITY_DN14315_c0_g1~~TRINITY_DN14315_c0_g1_i3.p1  ORF type:complete len:377 (-),score=90.83 TRINITY_DN14315_c0_g1_i3:79-1188(-)
MAVSAPRLSLQLLASVCATFSFAFARDLLPEALNLNSAAVSAGEGSSSSLKSEARWRAEALVAAVNSNPKAGWVAGINRRFEDATEETIRASLGAFLSLPMEENEEEEALQMRIGSDVVGRGVPLPEQFDAREKWPHCSTLFEIRDQGHCGSCWAFGAVEALSDRFCVQANVSVSLSAEDVLSCCGFWCGKGCDGGYPFRAWHYFVHRGVVSSSCLPYFDQDGCKHPNCEPVAPTPKCQRLCASGEKLQLEKYYARNAYYIFPPTQKNIMREVFLNGPIEVAFTVYEDFIYYKSGVYRHVQGGVVGGHAVKLIGWGTTEDGVDYWLLVNQWNRSWGEDGLFRYIRGINEGGLETSAVAGMVDLRRSKII